MSTSTMAINRDYPLTDQETGAPIIMPTEKTLSNQSKQANTHVEREQPAMSQKQPTNVVKLVKNAHGGIQINHNIQRVCVK